MSIRTQRQAILNVLLDARGGEIASPVLAKIALQYNARIFELRRRGFQIESRTEHIGDEIHGFFRLVSGTDALESGPKSPTGTSGKTPALKIPPKPPRRAEILPHQLSFGFDVRHG